MPDLRDAPWCEILAWFVAFAAAFVRLVSGVLRPKLDAGDILSACAAFAILLAAFAFRSHS